LILVFHLIFVIFWNVEHWIAKLGGQHSIRRWPSTQIFSFNFRPPWITKGSKLFGPKGGCYIFTSSIILSSATRMVIHGREKFTQSWWWESLCVLGRQLTGCLVDPNTSFPSNAECDLWRMTQKCNLPLVVASIVGSLGLYTLFNNSFLSSPWLAKPPCKYCLYIVNCLKAQT